MAQGGRSTAMARWTTMEANDPRHGQLWAGSDFVLTSSRRAAPPSIYKVQHESHKEGCYE
ncbi:hypothetical protein BS78_10G178800 [Paspalum vaginatum]|nr:hypothetical protein BS78_10G178800 [Paspalum vaginatum]